MKACNHCNVEHTEGCKGPDIRTMKDRLADALADAVAAHVRMGHLDARSLAGDALLDYRDPPYTEKSDALARLQEKYDRLANSGEVISRGQIIGEVKFERWLHPCAQCGVKYDCVHRSLSWEPGLERLPPEQQLRWHCDKCKQKHSPQEMCNVTVAEEFKDIIKSFIPEVKESELLYSTDSGFTHGDIGSKMITSPSGGVYASFDDGTRICMSCQTRGPKDEYQLVEATYKKQFSTKEAIRIPVLLCKTCQDKVGYGPSGVIQQS